MEQALGGCTEVQAAPKVHHSKKSSRPGHGCIPSGQHPRKREPVATKGQHGHPRSTGESTVEDQYLTAVVQPHSEDVEGISPRVLEDEIPQEVIGKVTRHHLPEGISPQQPVEKGSQEETETLNVLVNDGSSVGAYTLDLVVPPRLTSEITQLLMLEPKGFVRDLRSGKVK